MWKIVRLSKLMWHNIEESKKKSNLLLFLYIYIYIYINFWKYLRLLCVTYLGVFFVLTCSLSYWALLNFVISLLRLSHNNFSLHKIIYKSFRNKHFKNTKSLVIQLTHFGISNIQGLNSPFLIIVFIYERRRMTHTYCTVTNLFSLMFWKTTILKK